MKKLVISLLLVVVVVFGGGYFLAFTQSGNNILLPFINSYLKQKVDVASIMIESLTLKPNHIIAKANINKMVDVTLDGDFDILKKSYDMIYTLKAKKIETKEFKFDEKVYIKGKAQGDIKKALIFGVGKVANADIEYKLDLIDEKPQNITAKVDKAGLKKLLLLAGQKPYADGIVSLNANIPSLDMKNLNGKANLSVKNGSLNKTLLQKDFQVNLPKNTTFNLTSDALLKADKILASTDLKTNLANIKISNIIYNLKTKNLSSKYYLNIQNLSKLYSLADIRLRGNLKTHGNIDIKNNKLQMSLFTSSFGGKLEAYLVGDKLKATLKDIATNAVFYKLNLPKYTDARINGKIYLKSLKKLTGNFDINANGINKRIFLKKIYNFDSDRDIKYNLTTTGDIKNNILYAKVDIKNSFGDVKLDNLTYNIKTTSLKTPYKLYIDNLSKLNYIAKQKLVGNLKVTGDITKEKTLTIVGKSKKFDGEIDFKLQDDKLTAKVTNALLSKIEKTLSYPTILEAKTFADFNYNLKTSNGKAVITMKEAKMMPNDLTNIIKSLGGTDLSAQHYNDTKLIANLSKNLIVFDFKAISKAVSILINKGKIYQPSGKLDAKLIVKDKKREIPLKIAGTTSNPKIKLDSSFVKDELKTKAKEKLEKKLEEKLKNKLGIDNKDLANELLKKLF